MWFLSFAVSTKEKKGLHIRGQYIRQFSTVATMEEIKRFLAVCTALTLLVHDIVQAIDNFNNVEIVLKNQTARKMVGYNGAKFPNVENLFGVKGNQVTTL